MSFSNRMLCDQALPWSLDELEMPEIFPMLDSSPKPFSHDAVTAVDHSEHDEVERLLLDKQIYGDGFAAGEQAAWAEATSRIASAIDALAEATSMVKLHEDRWVSNAEENIAALAVAVARHIIGREVTVDPSGIRALVTRAVELLPIDQPIVVRLHPDDVDGCGSLIVDNSMSRHADIRWVADEFVLRGGCLVEGRERIIDGRIDTSLERAYCTIGNLQA